MDLHNAIFYDMFFCHTSRKEIKARPERQKNSPPLWFAGHKDIEAPRFKNLKPLIKPSLSPFACACYLPQLRVPAALQGGKDFYEDLCSTVHSGSRWSDKAPMDELQVTYAPAYRYSKAQDSLRTIDGGVLHGPGS